VTTTAMETITELLATVERLPEPRRSEARARVATALEGPATAARVALGALALDLLDDPHLHPASRRHPDLQVHARPRTA
jgi:hypothetical protein